MKARAGVDWFLGIAVVLGPLLVAIGVREESWRSDASGDATGNAECAFVLVGQVLSGLQGSFKF